MEILDKDFVEFIERCAGRDVRFLIAYDDLIANKKASGRSQDLVDVEILEENRPSTP